jgi:hypothetical protein
MLLADVLARAPASSIDEVIAIMTNIAQALPDADGLKWFNHLYLQVTLAVRDAVARSALQDAAFLARLDVVFANLYFAAAAAGQSDPRQAPPAWRPLLQARHDRRIARLQFALAGMNAHINRDLPEALVACYAEQGGRPARTDPRYTDYAHVNDILESVEARVKADFLIGALRAVDRAAAPLDDIVAMWNIRAARDAAWTHAEVLWNLRATPDLRAAFFATLDRLTGCCGRGLLVHVAPA